MGPWTDKQKKALDRLRLMFQDKCYYCDKKALYTQPDKDTGEIVDACKDHFNMNAAS